MPVDALGEDDGECEDGEEEHCEEVQAEEGAELCLGREIWDLREDDLIGGVLWQPIELGRVY